MYAVRRTSVRNWETMPVSDHYSVTVTRDGKSVPGIQPDRISAIQEDVMEWRKANHIHAWFVDNIQNGNDDCKEYYVPQEKLEELFRICEEVIKGSKLVRGKVYAGTFYDKDHPNGVVRRQDGRVIRDATVARNLLPTRKGFFFGSDEYDEYYLEEVVRTRDWLEEMLADSKNGESANIFYQSSW